MIRAQQKESEDIICTALQDALSGKALLWNNVFHGTFLLWVAGYFLVIRVNLSFLKCGCKDHLNY